MSTGRANSVVSFVPTASARARAARMRSTRAGRIAKYAQATRGPATARSLSAVGACSTTIVYVEKATAPNAASATPSPSLRAIPAIPRHAASAPTSWTNVV